METLQISRFLKSSKNAPKETQSDYFRVWQRAAVELQKSLRRWVPELYFDTIEKFEDRAAAQSVIVYAASRPCYGRPKTEFSYDLADPALLQAALRSIGNSLRRVLGPIERRLREAGRPDLGIRYAPVWYQDVLRAVEKKPNMLIELLAAEARLVDAVIDLGATSNVRKYQRAATLALGSVAGRDMSELAMRALDRVGENLTQKRRAANGRRNVVDGGIFQSDDVRAARRPDFRVGREENRDDGRTHGSGEMADAGIVADVDAGGREPARQLIKIFDADGAVEILVGSGAPFDR